MEIVSTLLGHSKIQTTQEHYRETEKLIKDSLLMNNLQLNILVYAQLGKRDKVYELFKNKSINGTNKGFGFAIFRRT